MDRILSLVATASLIAAQTPTYTPPPTPVAWSMKTVRSVQARVQSSAPTWDSNQKAWLANFPGLGTDPATRMAASLDTVNTATVEGSLFYVQTEGIGQDVQNACARKTNMSHIWFYDINISQPYFAVAEYGSDTGVVPEYGSFIAMDNGVCTKSGNVIPPNCMQITGLNYTANLGPYIGGEYRKTHPKANYENNIWFSFPGNCFLKPFGQKDPSCVSNPLQKGGMCPKGTQPDGVTCTYSFEVLGYVRIDDLVGITNMTNPNTGQNFKDRVEFCQAGKIEFDFTNNKSDLTFWNDPLNATANAVRAQELMNLYTSVVSSGVGDAAHMKPFPSVEALTKTNPPCYQNNIICSQSQVGCQRTLLAQVCGVCTSPSPACIKKPANEEPFPTLVKQIVPPLPTNAAGKVIVPQAAGGVNGISGISGGSASSALTASPLTAFVVTSLAFILQHY